METGITTERKNKLEQLYQAFKIVAEGAYVYICDMKYDYSRWSEEAAVYFGLPGKYMYQAGQIWEEHIHPEDQKSYHESLEAIFSGKDGGHDMQYRALDRRGKYVVCTCRGTVLKDEEGKPVYFVGCIRNNGEVNNFDSLTGFQNQYGLFEHLRVLCNNRVKANMMMIGIGHFSTVNEMWGYDFGNIVIHKLVQRLKEQFRNEGVLYRVNGVKFVLLTSTLSIEELESRFEILKKEIHEKLEVDGYHPNLRVYGSALRVKMFDVNPQALFSCLEYAYNQSKERGNGEFHIFRNEIDENRNNLLTLINTIRKSIEKDCRGFLLYYQPIVDAATHRLRGAEALLRWESKEYGLVPPSRFIGIIENDPAFVQLGEWILRRALEDAKPFLRECPDFKLNVNLSYEQLRQENFVAMVKKNLEKTGYPPENLCLEITERCRLLDLNKLIAIVSELRSMGICFAIDDFGTGYSSMDILNRLNCDIVKIDKVFVDHITEEGRNADLIAAINKLAGTCGAKVCVEGVENGEQCELIQKCGVFSIQGYYFSKPVPVQRFYEDFVLAERKNGYIK